MTVLRPYDPETVQGALVQVVCVKCGAGANGHARLTGECYALRRTNKRVAQLDSLR